MGDPFVMQGWSDWAYKFGNMQELVIPDLIDTLSAEGMTDEANLLRGEWEKKVKYFVYDDPHPFGSEMYFDSTGFESTHAVAKYGLENEVPPDVNLWQDKNTGVWYSHPNVAQEDFRQFMGNEIQANLAARGVVETHYYLLGSDLRGSGNTSYMLSYMTQMGGWSIVDYALYYSSEPEKYMRLGYASYLAGWALVNSGTPESNYGFWFPGPENDGAAGWAFKPERFGPTWMGRGDTLSQGRGMWRYDGEIDLGFSGGLRTAATVVVDDPIFGLFCYGGLVSSENNSYTIIPKDGLQQRIHLLVYQPELHIFLERDGFASSTPVVISKTLDFIQFRLENRYLSSHQTNLTIQGLDGEHYRARVGDLIVSAENQESAVLFRLPIREESEYVIVIERT
jgi:hypothetical protein